MSLRRRIQRDIFFRGMNAKQRRRYNDKQRDGSALRELIQIARIAHQKEFAQIVREEYEKLLKEEER